MLYVVRVAAGQDDSSVDAGILGCEYANVCYISRPANLVTD